MCKMMQITALTETRRFSSPPQHPLPPSHCPSVLFSVADCLVHFAMLCSDWYQALPLILHSKQHQCSNVDFMRRFSQWCGDWRIKKKERKKNHDNNRRHDNYVTADLFHSDAITAGQVGAPFKAILTNNNRGLVITDDERAGSHLCMYNVFGGKTWSISILWGCAKWQ